MNILCIKNTTKLVKGSKYEASVITDRYTTISINGKNYSCSTNNFRKLDGSVITERFDNKQRSSVIPYSWIKSTDDLKKGDVVVCTRGSKAFDSGKYYKISDIFKKVEQYKPSWSNTTRTKTTEKIKIEGYNRWVALYNFRLLTTQEKRDFSLSDLFGTKKDVNKAAEGRKIDRMSDVDKRRYILGTMFAAMCDTNKNNSTTVEWFVKIGKKYDLTEEDIKPYLKMKLSDIVKIM